MAANKRWKDEYWLMLMQLYLKKPIGVKHLYSRPLVDLALELHVSPRYLYRKMFQLRRLSTPRIERLWHTYSKKPEKLAKGVAMLRRMNGFNNAETFYEGVETNESFESEFLPLPGIPALTPAMLVMILDLYFRLTPNTMVEETPEIQHLATQLKIGADRVVEVMSLFQCCDPYLVRQPLSEGILPDACRKVWQQYGNDDPEKLTAHAAQLNEYFK